MDSKNARFILQSSQPGENTASDPQMADALRESDRDPELGAWLNRERAFDDALRGRLREVKPPQGLKAGVLAATPISLPEVRPRRRVPLAWAAALAVLATVASVWLWPREAAAGFAGFRSEMLRVAAERIRFDYSHGDARELERWLNARAGVEGIALPVGLKSLPALGCRELKWQGRPVGLICLKAGDGRAMHVFAVRYGALPDAPRQGAASFAASGGIQTATWRQGDVVYFAALQGSKMELRHTLQLHSL